MNEIVLAAQTNGQSSTGFLFVMVAVFAIMWLFMIRPQQKKQKEIRKFQNALSEGTRVVTGGGVFGTVKRVDLTTGKVEVEIAKNVVVTVDKGYVFADVSALEPKA